MTIERGLLGKIRSRGEEVLTQLSGELMSSPRLARAVEGALRGREKLEQAATRALRQMNVPTRSELKRAGARIDALEREVAELRRQLRSRRPPTPPRAAAGKSDPGRAARRPKTKGKLAAR
jgi:polyhydroxyalkanoate synthesis regulator phasin